MENIESDLERWVKEIAYIMHLINSEPRVKVERYPKEMNRRKGRTDLIDKIRLVCVHRAKERRIGGQLCTGCGQDKETLVHQEGIAADKMKTDKRFLAVAGNRNTGLKIYLIGTSYERANVVKEIFRT